jgi:spermidine synthase
MGDARVSLEQQAAQGFDLLVVDAFSGDSIPIHLLTAEAFSSYFRHLKPTGVLAVHTTNGYLELNPVVKTAASHFGKESLLIRNRPAQRRVSAASWVLIAAPGNELVRKLQEDADTDYPRLQDVRLWTDDYSSVLTVVRAWRRAG